MSHDADTTGVDPLRNGSHDFSEPELEQLLRDAYDAPPVPASLRARLDRTLPEALGLQTRPARTGAAALQTRKRRTRTVWQLAACAALVIAVVVSMRGDAQAYGWSKLVDALSRQSVVQLGSAGESSQSRWLSPAEGLLGVNTEDGAQLVDFPGGVRLQRKHSESQVRREPLDASALEGTPAKPSPETLVLSLLTGETFAAGDDSLPRWRNPTVLDESWARTNDEIELRVTFGRTGGNEVLRLVLRLDPETHLPRRADVYDAGGAVRSHTVTYPTQSARELAAETIPPHLPVVDAGSLQTQAESSENLTVAAQTNGSEVAVAHEPTTSRPVDEVALVGAASLGWEPVAIPQQSRNGIVESVDDVLLRLWQAQGLTPAAEARPEELLRRVYLDLTGRTPTVTEARAYLQDGSADRYERLVEQLLDSRDHATHLATVWRTFLLPEGTDLTRFGGTAAFDEWLSERFESNVPYDQLVRELLLAEGRLTKSGPLLFYTAAKLDADQLAARTARVFLGMRLDCAQCHDDPFEPWTQQDFWSFAAFFARISRPQAKLESVSTVMRVRDIDRGEVMLPDSETVVPPKFLDGTDFDETPGEAARRRELARWLTGADNPYFARAAANRVWAHLFGTGIVDPVDGFGKNHEAKSTELLDLLAGHFINNDFNLRELFRTIVLSRAYRLSSVSTDPESDRQGWFAQMNVKTLTAEQIYDCITVAGLLGAQTLESMDESGLLRGGNSVREAFLQQFGTPSGRRTEYERGIPQALTLMNGRLIEDATGLASSGLLKSLEAPFFTDDQRIEILYLATLSRYPTASEWALLRPYVAERAAGISVLEPLADILWALLNSAEFTMNH